MLCAGPGTAGGRSSTACAAGGPTAVPGGAHPSWADTARYTQSGSTHTFPCLAEGPGTGRVAGLVSRPLGAEGPARGSQLRRQIGRRSAGGRRGALQAGRLHLCEQGPGAQQPSSEREDRAPSPGPRAVPVLAPAVAKRLERKAHPCRTGLAQPLIQSGAPSVAGFSKGQVRGDAGDPRPALTSVECVLNPPPPPALGPSRGGGGNDRKPSSGLS